MSEDHSIYEPGPVDGDGGSGPVDGLSDDDLDRIEEVSVLVPGSPLAVLVAEVRRLCVAWLKAIGPPDEDALAEHHDDEETA